VAYVFDVGMDSPDWRVRVRRRGGWMAFGCITDLAFARQLAQRQVENPTEPKPSKFNVPLNLIGGYRWPSGLELDSQTAAYVRRLEVGAVKVEAPNEQPAASGDDESINLCAEVRGEPQVGDAERHLPRDLTDEEYVRRDEERLRKCLGDDA
jgi:hypothetical protein